ncbi:MAG: hypothetical protein QOF28_1087 [Actinomycetota bacterium]|jgi:glycosyltransferase involved in cell wall biosynthesis|nr:hypothetical protein [Actinomycetota bacterium]
MTEEVARSRHLGYVLKRFPRISETFIAAELIELERQGERVSVFAVSRPEEPFTHRFVDELGASVVYLPHRLWRQPRRVLFAVGRTVRASPKGFLRAAGASFWPPSAKRWRHLLQATVLRDEMAAAGVDHVHAHFATSAAQLAELARRMDGPSYSVTTHAKDIWHEDVEPETLRRRLLPAEFVATVSDDNRRHLESVLGPSTALHVVPNSVDLRRLQRSPAARQPEPDTVLTVARLIEKKGLADLVEAGAILARRSKPIRFEIVGDGPLRASLEAAAARAGVDVRFHGALPQEEVLDHYRRAAVFCLPCVVASTGDRDGLPTSVLEAMALGVPVVTTAVNGLADAVISEQTGLVVNEHDSAALADALERLLADPQLAAHLSAAARCRVEENYSLERSVRLLRSLFPEAT